MKAIDKFDVVQKALAQKQINALLRSEADKMATKIKAAAPADTGMLRESIVAIDTKTGAMVAATDPAAIMQEYGTTRHGDQPFMRPTFENHAVASLSTIEKEIKKIIKGIK